MMNTMNSTHWLRRPVLSLAGLALLLPIGLTGCKSSPEGPIKPQVEDWEDLLNASIDAIEQEMIQRLDGGSSRKRVLASNMRSVVRGDREKKDKKKNKNKK